MADGSQTDDGIAKSSIVIDVKPWDSDTDMAAMEKFVRSIQMDGLFWGASGLVDVGYGLKKLRINAVVQDGKVTGDDLEEALCEGDGEEWIQGMDVASVTKNSRPWSDIIKSADDAAAGDTTEKPQGGESAAEAQGAKDDGIAKSSIVIDVKPWDSDTDMAAMEKFVRSIQMDGLFWGASGLVDVGYGLKKLRINAVVQDGKVTGDDLEEALCEGDGEEWIQGMDVASVTKNSRPWSDIIKSADDAAAGEPTEKPQGEETEA